MSAIPVVVEKVDTDLEKIEKVLSVYSIMKNIKLRPFERLVLKYYIKYGYSDEAKEFLIEDENRKKSDLKNADFELRSKGFIVQSSKNNRSSELSVDMESIRKHFVIGNSDIYLISFKDLPKND